MRLDRDCINRKRPPPCGAMALMPAITVNNLAVISTMALRYRAYRLRKSLSE
ncbi:hypothetical protein KCP76_10050 [Salmonella enterica subsp. enterica serovar Weltevreden]|nr:hypothetical protein KCP76_10050 [Salmonella enterica subsp. enterica serovar Weltevreden]